SRDEGRADVDGIDDLVSYSDANGDTQVPMRVTLTRAASFHPDPHHDCDSVARQLDSGFMKEFQRAHPHADDPGDIIGYLTRDELPVTYFLADEFTVCDRWFCSVPTSTIPNRMYALGGHAASHRNTPEALALGLQKTVFEHLQERGVSWKAYCGVFPSVALR